MSLAIDDLFFFVSVAGLICILFYKIINVFHKGIKFKLTSIFVSFILSIILKYIILVGLLTNPTSVLYLSISNYCNVIYITIWLMFIVEIILNIATAIKNRKGSYKPTTPDYLK